MTRVETGARNPSLPLLERLFAALQVQLRVEVEALDADVDAAIAELAATELSDRLAALRIPDLARSLAGIPFVFDGTTAALLQAAPLPDDAVQVALSWDSADAFTDWLGQRYGQRWHARWQQFGYRPLNPRYPGEHRWTTIFGEIRAQMCAELPASIEVRHAGVGYPVVPLAEVQLADPRTGALLERYRQQRGGSTP